MIANTLSIVRSKIPILALLDHLDQVSLDSGLFTYLTHRRGLGGLILFDNPLGKLPPTFFSYRDQRDVDLSSTGPKRNASCGYLYFSLDSCHYLPASIAPVAETLFETRPESIINVIIQLVMLNITSDAAEGNC
jgi:hypothetical protein